MVESLMTQENEVRVFRDEEPPTGVRCNAAASDTIEDGTAHEGKTYVGAADRAVVWAGRNRVRELRSTAALPPEVDVQTDILMRRFERLKKKQNVRVQVSDPIIVMVVMMGWHLSECGTPSLKRILTAINHIKQGQNKVHMKDVHCAKRYLVRMDPNGEWVLPNVDQMTDLISRSLMGMGKLSPAEHIMFEKAFGCIEKLPLGRHRSYPAFLGACMRAMRLANLPFAVEWDDARIASVVNIAPATMISCMNEVAESVHSEAGLIQTVKASVGFA
jgi:hypothetical protein